MAHSASVTRAHARHRVLRALSEADRPEHAREQWLASCAARPPKEGCVPYAWLLEQATQPAQGGQGLSGTEGTGGTARSRPVREALDQLEAEGAVELWKRPGPGKKGRALHVLWVRLRPAAEGGRAGPACPCCGAELSVADLRAMLACSGEGEQWCPTI